MEPKITIRYNVHEIGRLNKSIIPNDENNPPAPKMNNETHVR